MGSKNRDLAAEAARLELSAQSARANMYVTHMEQERGIAARYDALNQRQKAAEAAAGQATEEARIAHMRVQALKARVAELEKHDSTDSGYRTLRDRLSREAELEAERETRLQGEAAEHTAQAKALDEPIKDVQQDYTKMQDALSDAGSEIGNIERKARLLKEAHEKANGDDPVARLSVDDLIEEADGIQIDVAKIEAVESGGWNRHDVEDTPSTPMALPDDSSATKAQADAARKAAETRRLAERDKPDVSDDKQVDLEADDAAQVRELATVHRAEAQIDFEREATKLRLDRNDAARDEYAAREEAKAAEMQIKRENRAFTEAREKFEARVKEAHENTDPAKAAALNDLATHAESDLRIANARLEAAQKAVGTQTAIAEQKHRDVADLEAKFSRLQQERAETEKAIDGLEHRAGYLEDAQRKFAEAQRINDPKLREQAETEARALVEKANHVKVDHDALVLDKPIASADPVAEPEPAAAASTAATGEARPAAPTDQAGYEKAAIDLTTQRDEVARNQWEAEKGANAAKMQINREQAKVDAARSKVEQLNREADTVAPKDPDRAEYLREQAQKAGSDQRVAEAELKEAQDTAQRLQATSDAAKAQVVDLERQSSELREQWENTAQTTLTVRAGLDEPATSDTSPVTSPGPVLTEAELQGLSTHYAKAAQAAHDRRLDEARTLDAEEKASMTVRLERDGAQTQLDNVRALRERWTADIDKRQLNIERLNLEASELERQKKDPKLVEEKLEEADLEMAKIEGTKANLKDLDQRETDLTVKFESLSKQRDDHLAKLESRLKRLDDTADTLDDASRAMGDAYRQRHKAEELRAEAAKPGTDPDTKARLEKQAQAAETQSVQSLAKARQIMPDDAAVSKALADVGVPDPSAPPPASPPSPATNQPTNTSPPPVPPAVDKNVGMEQGLEEGPDRTTQTALADDVVGDADPPAEGTASGTAQSDGSQTADPVAAEQTAGSAEAEVLVGDESPAAPQTTAVATANPDSDGTAVAASDQPAEADEPDGVNDPASAGVALSHDISAEPLEMAESEIGYPDPAIDSQPAPVGDASADEFSDGSSGQVEEVPG